MSIQIKQEQEFTTNRDNLGIPTAKTIQYLVHGAISEEEAFAKLKETASFYLDNLKLNEYEINEVKGGGAYTYDVNYAKMSAAEYGDMTSAATPIKYSFDTSGGSVNIKQALSDARLPVDAPDMKNGINWDGEQFNGVDIVVANIVESHSITVARSKLTTTYKRKLAELTGKVNNATFKGWKQSEVLFLGASASDASDDYVDINFKFAISPIKENFEFAGMGIVKKGGWEYAWALYEDQNEENKPILPMAIAVYLCEIYEEKDFKDLGLGK